MTSARAPEESARPGERAPEAVDPATRTLAWWTGRSLSASWLRVVHRLRVEEGHRIPRAGGVLVVANHQSFLDIPIVAAAVPRHVTFVARETLARSRFLGWLMRESRAILIRPGAADRAALAAMVARLRAGEVVCVFPEGTRSVDGTLGEFRAGALFAAKRARVPIVPAGIRGALDALPRHARLPRPRRIAIRFGEPIDGTRPDAMEAARAAISGMIGDGRFGKIPGS